MSSAKDIAQGRGAHADGDVELPRRNEGEPSQPGQQAADVSAEDLEAGRRSMTAPAVDPSKLLDPIRTDPVKALELRKRRLDRQADSSMPEIHYVGQITSAKKVITDTTEGVFCRYVSNHSTTATFAQMNLFSFLCAGGK